MRSKENKLYVNIKTGVVYHKPVKVNGVKFEPSKDFYEITAEQAKRLDAGESLRAVLREGIREKVESELASTLKEGSAPAVAPEVPVVPVAPAAPLDLDADTEDEVEGFTTHKEIDAFAAAKGLEIPADCTTMQTKKDFIKTALLAG
jgi:hypothetical protein